MVFSILPRFQMSIPSPPLSVCKRNHSLKVARLWTVQNSLRFFAHSSFHFGFWIMKHFSQPFRFYLTTSHMRTCHFSSHCIDSIRQKVSSFIQGLLVESRA